MAASIRKNNDFTETKIEHTDDGNRSSFVKSMMNSKLGSKQKQIDEEKKISMQEHKDTLTDISEDDDD